MPDVHTPVPPKPLTPPPGLPPGLPPELDDEDGELERKREVNEQPQTDPGI